ncbi:Glycine receptor subunit alphaZ1-like [Homarus americanus]|uniref:Glycine receptor subunit alphaZ1-like n=3 Tax=Homarus americanus TaxID=6706 RepID=A0A8J5MWG7_HOMAM|nr:Glycine receptor subunit alphaZ1-like [Homarus americanus]
MQLQIQSASSEYLIFNSNDSYAQYLGQKFLIEYGIGLIDLQVDNAMQYSEMKVRIELIRRYGYAMLNIYIPSLTLLIISYVTLFFRPTIFEVRVMTALTALLVLATLFTQVSTSLPKTSYFKMVDIWLLFCIVLIFFIIIFHTIIDFHVDYSNTGAPLSSKGWVGTSQRSSGSNIVKVTPVGGNTKSGDEDMNNLSINFLKVRFDAKFYINLSKLTMFLVFFVFNITYWGTLAVGSGLVYYY